MIKSNIKTIAAIVIIFILGMTAVWWATSDNKDAQGTQSIQENLQASATANRLQSARVKRGVYLLDRKAFEEDVIEGLKTTKGMGFDKLQSDNQVKFAYLLDSSASDVNGKFTDNKGNKVTEDVTKETSPYIAIKGVRVLIDANNDGNFTSEEDTIATLALDVRSSDKHGEK